MIIDSPIFNWLHFFDVMVWWKWPLAILLICAEMAIITGFLIGIKYFWGITYKNIDKIMGDDEEDK